MQRLRGDQATSRLARTAVHAGARIDALIHNMPCEPAARHTWDAVLHARAQQRDGRHVHVRGVQHDARSGLLQIQLDGHRARHLLRVMRIYSEMNCGMHQALAAWRATAECPVTT